MVRESLTLRQRKNAEINDDDDDVTTEVDTSFIAWFLPALLFDQSPIVKSCYFESIENSFPFC